MAATVTTSVKVASASAAAALETTAITPGGSDRVLYALVGCGSWSPADPTAVKFGGSGGTSMAQIGTTLNVGSFVKISLWRLIAPAASSGTIHAAWSGSHDERWIIGVAVQDADQTTPNGTVASAAPAESTNHTPSVNVTTVSGDLVLDFMSWLDLTGAALTCAPDASQASIQELDGGGISAYEGAGASSETAAGTSTTMSWSISGSNNINWGIFGINVNAATGGGTPKSLPPRRRRVPLARLLQF